MKQNTNNTSKNIDPELQWAIDNEYRSDPELRDGILNSLDDEKLEEYIVNVEHGDVKLKYPPEEILKKLVGFGDLGNVVTTMRGGNGVAIITDKNLVIKITGDEAEFLTAQKLKNINNDYIVNVYDSKILDKDDLSIYTEDSKLAYLIVMDKLDHPTPQQEQDWDDCCCREDKPIYVDFTDVVVDIHQPVDGSQKCWDIYNDIINIRKAVEKTNRRWVDIGIDNVAIKNGHYVLIDLGTDDPLPQALNETDITTQKNYNGGLHEKYGKYKVTLFKYWDSNGANVKPQNLKLIGLDVRQEKGLYKLINKWLVEWHGGREKAIEIVKEKLKGVHSVLDGGYDFKYTVTSIEAEEKVWMEQEWIGVFVIIDGGGTVDASLGGLGRYTLWELSEDQTLDDIRYEIERELLEVLQDTLINLLSETGIIVSYVTVERTTKPNHFPPTEYIQEAADMFGQGLLEPIELQQYDTEEEWEEDVAKIIVPPKEEEEYGDGKTDAEKGFVAPSKKVTENICTVEGFCKEQGPITFGQLRALVEGATSKRIGSDLMRGGFKSLWRIVPFFLPQILFASVGVTVTRALNKIISPALVDTKGYKSWWGKAIMKAMDIAEGDYIPDVALGDDPLSKVFFISDGLLEMVRDKYKLKFARYVAEVASNKPDNEPVPEWFVENLLRDYLNQKFLLNPPLPPKENFDKENLTEHIKRIKKVLNEQYEFKNGGGEITPKIITILKTANQLLNQNNIEKWKEVRRTGGMQGEWGELYEKWKMEGGAKKFHGILRKFFDVGGVFSGSDGEQISAILFLIVEEGGGFNEDSLTNLLDKPLPNIKYYTIDYYDEDYDSTEEEEECARNGSEFYGLISGEECYCLEWEEIEADDIRGDRECTDSEKEDEECDCNQMVTKYVEMYFYNELQSEYLTTIDLEHNGNITELTYNEKSSVELQTSHYGYTDNHKSDDFSFDEGGNILDISEHESDVEYYLEVINEVLYPKEDMYGDDIITEERQLDLFNGAWPFDMGIDDEQREELMHDYPENAVNYLFKKWDQSGLNWQDLKLLGIDYGHGNYGMGGEVMILKRYIMNTKSPIPVMEMWDCNDLSSLFDDDSHYKELTQKYLCGDDPWDWNDYYTNEFYEGMLDDLDDGNWKMIMEILGVKDKEIAGRLLNEQPETDEEGYISESLEDEIYEIRSKIGRANNIESEDSTKREIFKEIDDLIVGWFDGTGKLVRSDENGSYSWIVESDLKNWLNEDDWDNTDFFQYHMDYSDRTLEDIMRDMHITSPDDIFKWIMEEEFGAGDEYNDGKRGDKLEISSKYYDGYWYPNINLEYFNDILSDDLHDLMPNTNHPKPINEALSFSLIGNDIIKNINGSKISVEVDSITFAHYNSITQVTNKGIIEPYQGSLIFEIINTYQSKRDRIKVGDRGVVLLDLLFIGVEPQGGTLDNYIKHTFDFNNAVDRKVLHGLFLYHLTRKAIYQSTTNLMKLYGIQNFEIDGITVQPPLTDQKTINESAIHADIELGGDDTHIEYGSFTPLDVKILNTLIKKMTHDELVEITTMDEHAIPDELHSNYRNIIKLFGEFNGSSDWAKATRFAKWAIDNWDVAADTERSGLSGGEKNLYGLTGEDSDYGRVVDYGRVLVATKAYPSVYEVVGNQSYWQVQHTTGEVDVPAFSKSDAANRAEGSFFDYEPEMEWYDSGDSDDYIFDIDTVTHSSVLKEQIMGSEGQLHENVTNFKELYSISPPKLKKIVADQWKAKQNPEYHPEGNTLKHIITVTNRAFYEYPENFNIILAAYFHDLGKLATASTNPKTGHPTAYGHEKVSTDLVKDYSEFIESMGADPDIVEYLVSNHMKIKPRVWDVMRQSKKEVISNNPSFNDLESLTKLDKGGLHLKENINPILENYLKKHYTDKLKEIYKPLSIGSKLLQIEKEKTVERWEKETEERMMKRQDMEARKKKRKRGNSEGKSEEEEVIQKELRKAWGEQRERELTVVRLKDSVSTYRTRLVKLWMVINEDLYKLGLIPNRYVSVTEKVNALRGLSEQPTIKNWALNIIDEIDGMVVHQTMPNFGYQIDNKFYNLKNTTNDTSIIKEQIIDTKNLPPEKISPPLKVGDKIFIWDLVADPAPPGGYGETINLPSTTVGVVAYVWGDDDIDEDSYRGGIKYDVDTYDGHIGLYQGEMRDKNKKERGRIWRDKWIILNKTNLNEINSNINSNLSKKINNEKLLKLQKDFVIKKQLLESISDLGDDILKTNVNLTMTNISDGRSNVFKYLNNLKETNFTSPLNYSHFLIGGKKWVEKYQDILNVKNDYITENADTVKEFVINSALQNITNEKLDYNLQETRKEIFPTSDRLIKLWEKSL